MRRWEIYTQGGTTRRVVPGYFCKDAVERITLVGE